MNTLTDGVCGGSRFERQERAQAALPPERTKAEEPA